MQMVRIHKHIESETLHLPELRPLIGKNVEIVVQEEATAAAGELDLSALEEIAGQDLIDPEAYKQLRADSVL